MPKFLYKYYRCTDYNFDAIKNRQLFMCSPLEFNDPYDSRIRISSGNHEEFFNFVLSYLEYKKIRYGSDAVYVASAKLGFPLHDIDSSQKEFNFPSMTDLFYELLFKIQDLDDFYSYAREQNLNENALLFLKFITRSGITSFSSQYEDPHMWAYYADNLKGFCVKYKVRKTDLYKLSKVRYYKNPLKYLSKRKISTSDLESYVLSKSDHWKFEKEYRLLSCNGRNSLVESPFEIESICSGLRMDKDNLKILRSVSNSRFPMYYSLLDEKKFKIRWIEEETCFL